MKSLRFKILAIAISALLTHVTMAGALIEPYLGYSLGSGDSGLASGNWEHSYTSPTIGGRLGYQQLGLMFGLDYSMQSFDLESEAGSTTLDDGVKKNQLGLFVGYNLPILMRVWGTYYVSATMEGDDAPSTNQLISNRYEFSDGSGYALGVGFTGLPFVSLNIEYRTIEYDKFEVSSGTGPTYDDKMALSEILFSVSLPLNL